MCSFMTIADQLMSNRSAKTVDATVDYRDPHDGQKYILMINQAVQINIPENHLLCIMQCHLNVVHISEVPKFLADRPTVTTCAVPLLETFDSTHALIIPLQPSNVIS